LVSVIIGITALAPAVRGSKISHFCSFDICDTPSSLFPYRINNINIRCGELICNATADPCEAHDWDEQDKQHTFLERNNYASARAHESC